MLLFFGIVIVNPAVLVRCNCYCSLPLFLLCVTVLCYVLLFLRLSVLLARVVWVAVFVRARRAMFVSSVFAHVVSSCICAWCCSLFVLIVIVGCSCSCVLLFSLFLFVVVGLAPAIVLAMCSSSCALLL